MLPDRQQSDRKIKKSIFQHKWHSSKRGRGGWGRCTAKTVLARTAAWPEAWAGISTITSIPAQIRTEPRAASLCPTRSCCSTITLYSISTGCPLNFSHPFLFLPCFHFLSQVKSRSTYLCLSFPHFLSIHYPHSFICFILLFPCHSFPHSFFCRLP